MVPIIVTAQFADTDFGRDVCLPHGEATCLWWGPIFYCLIYRCHLCMHSKKVKNMEPGAEISDFVLFCVLVLTRKLLKVESIRGQGRGGIISQHISRKLF